MIGAAAADVSVMAGSGAGMLPELWRAAAVFGPQPPKLGERAMGHGVSGAVVAVPEQQPLATDDVWRVTLAGEGFGRLVGRARDGACRLLQLDDLTDAQLETYEAAMLLTSTAATVS